MSAIKMSEDGVRPIIVQFQNSKLQVGEEKKLQAGVYRHSRKKTIVAVATKDILYTGNVNRKEETYNNVLLIVNRKTGERRLVLVDTVSLTPTFNQKQVEVVDNAPVLNNNRSISELNKQFGSKKIIRITQQRERLTMNIDDVKAQLEETVAGVEVNESELFTSFTGENESIYRPPINRDAATKEQVYVLNDMVPESVLDSLEEEANYLLTADLNSLDLNPFIKQHLTELQNSMGSNQLDKCKLLLYLHYLMQYITKPAKVITKKFVACESSRDVNLHILDNFSVTSNTGRTRPFSMRDKTICYILVLSMIALDYQVDIEELSKNVKLGVKKLQEMGKILAFSAGKSKNVMILKLPLPPAVSMSPKKRKR